MSKGARNRLLRRTQYVEMTEIRTGISTASYFWLKIIALLCFFFDTYTDVLYDILKIPDTVYLTSKILGKASIPIFGFLIVECVLHSEKKFLHLLRLCTIGLICELPYNYTVYHRWFSADGQNPVLTAAVCFMCVAVINCKISESLRKLYRSEAARKSVAFFFKILFIGGCGTFAHVFRLWGDWYAVLLVVLLWTARKLKHTYSAQIVALAIYVSATINYLLIPLGSLFALIPILIEECRNRNDKYFVKVERLSFVPNLLSSAAVRWICRLFYPVSITALAGAIYFLK